MGKHPIIRVIGFILILSSAAQAEYTKSQGLEHERERREAHFRTPSTGQQVLLEKLYEKTNDIDLRLKTFEKNSEQEILELKTLVLDVKRSVETISNSLGALQDSVHQILNQDQLSSNDSSEILKPFSAKQISVVCHYYAWFSTKIGGRRFAPENIDPNLCTDIVYSRADLDLRKSTIKALYPELEETTDYYARVTELKKKNRRLKISLSIADESNAHEFCQLLKFDQNKRSDLIKNTISFLRNHNFDGLHLYWRRSWTCSDNQFLLFLRDLRNAFDRNQPRLLLSVYVENNDVDYKSDAVADVSKLVDRFDVTLLAPCPKQRTCHRSPLYNYTVNGESILSMNELIDVWKHRGVPLDKMAVTLPAYTEVSKLSDPRQHKIGHGVDTLMEVKAYNEFCRDVMSRDWTVTNVPGIGTYAYKGSQWLSYEDPRSLVEKSVYAKERELRGIGLSFISYDDHKGLCCKAKYPLLNAINFGLGTGNGLKPSQLGCTDGSAIRRQR